MNVDGSSVSVKSWAPVIDSAESKVEYRSKVDLPLPFTDADVPGVEVEVEVDARVPKPFSPSLPPS